MAYDVNDRYRANADQYPEEPIYPRRRQYGSSIPEPWPRQRREPKPLDSYEDEPLPDPRWRKRPKDPSSVYPDNRRNRAPEPPDPYEDDFSHDPWWKKRPKDPPFAHRDYHPDPSPKEPWRQQEAPQTNPIRSNPTQYLHSYDEYTEHALISSDIVGDELFHDMELQESFDTVLREEQEDYKKMSQAMSKCMALMQNMMKSVQPSTHQSKKTATKSLITNGLNRPPELTKISARLEKEGCDEDKPENEPDELDQLAESQPMTILDSDHKQAELNVVLYDQYPAQAKVSILTLFPYSYTNIVCENMLDRVGTFKIKHPKPPDPHWSSKYTALKKAEQISLPISMDITASTTKPGFYEWLFMMFGLTTAPSPTVQNPNQVLSTFGNPNVLYYPELCQSGRSLELFCEPLRRNGLNANPMKCIFITNGLVLLSCVAIEQVQARALANMAQKYMPFEPGDWRALSMETKRTRQPVSKSAPRLGDPLPHQNGPKGKLNDCFTADITNLLCFNVGETVLRSKLSQGGGDGVGPESGPQTDQPVTDPVTDPATFWDLTAPKIISRAFTEESKTIEVTSKPANTRPNQPTFDPKAGNPHIISDLPDNGDPHQINGLPDNGDPHQTSGYPDNGNPYLTFRRPASLDDQCCIYLIIDRSGTIKDEPPDLSEFRRTVVRVALFSLSFGFIPSGFPKKGFNEAIRITNAEFVRAATSPGPFEDRARVRVDLLYHLDYGPPSPPNAWPDTPLMPNQSGINRVSIRDQSSIHPESSVINAFHIRQELMVDSTISADWDFLPEGDFRELRA